MSKRINDIIKILQDAVIYSRDTTSKMIVTRAIEELKKLRDENESINQS